MRQKCLKIHGDLQQLRAGTDGAAFRKKEAYDAAKNTPPPQLPTIDVSDYDAQMKKYFDSLDTERARKDALSQAYSDAATACTELKSQMEGKLASEFFFDNLPAPISSTQTNADGKFSITMPTKGQYVLCAHASRMVFDETEQYGWSVATTLDGKPNASLLLTNSNMSSSSSTDSLIKTAY